MTMSRRESLQYPRSESSEIGMQGRRETKAVFFAVTDEGTIAVQGTYHGIPRILMDPWKSLGTSNTYGCQSRV